VPDKLAVLEASVVVEVAAFTTVVHTDLAIHILDAVEAKV
jgi:hypothetical protein